MTPTDPAPSPASRRRAKQAERLAAARRGVSLGLEDEVQFDISEDLMEDVGEIPLAPTHAWYPGKPDSPPLRKGGLHPHPDSSRAARAARAGLLSRRDKQRTKGLDDARLVLPPDGPGGEAGGGHSRRGSEHSLSGSSVFTATTGTTGTTGATGATSTTRLDGLSKDKSRSRVFGKLFGKKKDASSGSTVGSRSIAGDSVESFGSASRLSDTSQPRSIFITPAHLPPSHVPPSRISSDPASSLASLPTTPHSVASAFAPRRAGGHVSHPSGASDAPLITDFDRIGISPMPTSQSYDTFNSHDEYVQHTKPPSAHGHFDPVPPPAQPAVVRAVKDGPDVEETRQRDQTNASDASAPSPSPDVRSQSSASPSRTPHPSSSAESPTPALPPYPTSETSLDAIAALSTTVMRRQRVGQAPPEQQTAPGSSGSNASLPRKPIWQTHQLILTAFRPELGLSPLTADQQSRTTNGHATAPARTVVHLHLYAYTAPSRGSARAAPVGEPTPGGGGPRRVGSLDGATKVEVERRRIDASTTAGVWENHEGQDHDARSRKWVLRIRWGEDRGERDEREEWLCDMPTGDTLCEWVRQIKAYAALIKAETLDDAPMLPVVPAVLTSPQPENGDSTRDPTNANGGPSPSIPPISHAQTEDLATMLDKADLEWRLRHGETPRGSDGQVSSASLSARRVSPDRERLPDQAMSRSSSVRSSGKTGSLNSSLVLPPGPPPPGPLPPAPLASDRSMTTPVATPQRLRAGSASQSPAPSLPPPTIPLPSVPHGEPQGLEQDHRPDVSFVSYATEAAAAAGVSPVSTPKEHVYEFPLPPSTPSLPLDDAFAAALAESPLTVQLDGTKGFAAEQRPDQSARAAQGEDDQSTPLRHGPSAWEDKDDGASISSKGSSARTRRLARKQQPAMDLMAELSGRPEMNFERPAALQPDTTPIDEDRPRRIRFV